MFRNESRLARSPVAGALRAAIPALAFAAGLALASPGQATTYVFEHGSMDHARTLNIQGIGNVKAAPVLFDGYIQDTGEVFSDLVAFCVDVYHSISLTNYNPDLTYTDEIPLTTDSNYNGPDILSSDQILQVERLVNYGTNVFYNAAADTNAHKTARWDELAVVQGAIWQVVSGRNVFSGNNTLNARIDLLAGANYQSAFNLTYGAVGSNIDFLTPFTDRKDYPNRHLTQAFAIAGVVPEPATWVMMIGGFAVAGAALRARRRRETLAA
jgi:hypothetical protein